jgi:hypothetical protein
MKLKQLIMTAVALATLMYMQAVTQADPLVFVNSPPVVVAGQGTTVLFSITISNSGPGLLTITGADFGGFSLISNPLVSDPGLQPDILPFFNNFVLNDPDFSQGESRSGVALSLTVGPNVAFGAYLGQFTIFYDGATGPDQQVSQDFTVNVIPEPTTMLLFGTGLAGAAGAKLRKRWRAKTQ